MYLVRYKPVTAEECRFLFQQNAFADRESGVNVIALSTLQGIFSRDAVLLAYAQDEEHAGVRPYKIGNLVEIWCSFEFMLKCAEVFNLLVDVEREVWEDFRAACHLLESDKKGGIKG